MQKLNEFIATNTPYAALPEEVKLGLGNQENEYSKRVQQYSIKNQIQFRGNLVQHVGKKDEKAYYLNLLQHSRSNLMLYPYHLSKVFIRGLRITPFYYYREMMEELMLAERSYDTLPNFTAADCVRLLGIGRNQYIDVVNMSRTAKTSLSNWQKMFRRNSMKSYLPSQPVEIPIELWFIVYPSLVSEHEVKMCTTSEKAALDRIIAAEWLTVSHLDIEDLQGLHSKGLVYFGVPIAPDDIMSVPPLDGFVMNRVLGDDVENFLYKVFHVLDECSTIAELADILKCDVNQVTDAVSVLCRLGFCHKKKTSIETRLPSPKSISKNISDMFNLENMSEPVDMSEAPKDADPDCPADLLPNADFVEFISARRIAFIFDSTLTAFLMMGNLTPGLKTHAVTMFEVGKLADESLDSFLTELEKISHDAGDHEGEALRFFQHARILRDTLQFIRLNSALCSGAQALDLVRCESLDALDSATRSRLLQKNYSLLVSMAPLSLEARSTISWSPFHLGPAIPEVNSVWFKLFIYSRLRDGPPSLLIPHGCMIQNLPSVFHKYEKLLMTSWGHDAGLVPTSNVLLVVNEAVVYSSVFLQGHSLFGSSEEEDIMYLPFPFHQTEMESYPSDVVNQVTRLEEFVNLKHSIGYITLIRSSHNGQPADRVNKRELLAPMTNSEIQDMLEIDSSLPPSAATASWQILDVSFGLPLFKEKLNQHICKSIKELNLFDSESLQLMLDHSQKLSIELLKFISYCLNDSFDLNDVAAYKVLNPDIPKPNKTMIFSDGNLLTYFD